MARIDKTDEAAPADPAAIDLVKRLQILVNADSQLLSWQRSARESIVEAAVEIEALRGREVELASFIDDWESQFVCWGMLSTEEENKAIGHFIERARTVLVATPAQAMERARAIDRVLKAAQFFMEDGIAEDSPDLNKVAWQSLNDALTALDALGKEAT